MIYQLHHQDKVCNEAATESNVYHCLHLRQTACWNKTEKKKKQGTVLTLTIRAFSPDIQSTITVFVDQKTS